MGVITTDNPRGAGRNTILTDELFKQIKQCVLDGLTLKEIANVTEINEGTFYVWHSDNYLGLADRIENWRRDRKLMLAENVLIEMLEMPTLVEDVKALGLVMKKRNGEVESVDMAKVVRTEPSLVRIKQDTAKFIAETLGKERYSKRSELTGEGGKDLFDLKTLLHKANDTGEHKTDAEVAKLSDIVY